MSPICSSRGPHQAFGIGRERLNGNFFLVVCHQIWVLISLFIHYSLPFQTENARAVDACNTSRRCIDVFVVFPSIFCSKRWLMAESIIYM